MSELKSLSFDRGENDNRDRRDYPLVKASLHFDRYNKTKTEYDR